MKYCVVWLVIFKELLQSHSNTVNRRNAFNFEVLDFNVNDLMEQSLMPMEILSQKQVKNILQYMNNEAQSDATRSGNRLFPVNQLGVNSSDFKTALNTMYYHRQMINAYLASDYIVQSMLRDRLHRELSPELTINKRMGEVHNDSNRQPNQPNRNQRLLDDEGMTKYKSWIEKTITLEDIHRQLGNNYKIHTNAKQPNNHRRHLFDVESTADIIDNNENGNGNVNVDDNEDIEDGDITGYALASHPYKATHSNGNHQYWPFMTMSTSNLAPADIQIRNPYMRAINKNGYESAYDDHEGHPPVYVSHPPQPAASILETIQSKEISIKDITDIALTTLAFLSFGMFILQVLMCITMGKEDSSNMMVLPMESTDTEVDGDGTEEIRRMRRSTTHHNRRLLLMNELARRVLFSIDAVLAVPRSGSNDGTCHYWALCENNRFAKAQPNGQKFWIPIWRQVASAYVALLVPYIKTTTPPPHYMFSMGISWLTSRVWSTTNTGEYVPIMNSLKAIVIGLGKGECEAMYKNGCKHNRKE